MADDATIEKAGKLLGAVEQIAGKKSDKAFNDFKKLKRAFLTAAARAEVWSDMVMRIEDATTVDIDEWAEELGMDLDQLAKANPNAIIQKLTPAARSGAEERIFSDSLEDVLDIDNAEWVKAVKSTRL